MKRILTCAIVLTTLSTQMPAVANEAATQTVTAITVGSPAKPSSVEGNINAGKKISLGWAELSNVACFPATRFEQFDGNHVFYRVPMSASSSLKITMTPKDNAAINLYALRQSAAGNQPVPPDVTTAISAEASYPKYARISATKKIQNKDDGVRKIEFTSVGNPYSILIGVAGANGLTEGGFKLNVEQTAR
ncbi:MAG: hypothetical protein SGJ27_30960 [Candidatus Melainabacteria bacterium]|nr:hypothetical protein [Candidatus Melainabacteria bacterium]